MLIKKYIRRLIDWLHKQKNMIELRWLWSQLNQDERREWYQDLKYAYWRHSQKAKSR